MSAPDVDLFAALRRACDAVIDGRPRAWDEGLEQRISQIAESIDEETGEFRRLSPRRWAA